MAVEIVMPAMEMDQEKSRLVRWLKAEGEFVRKGEPLIEVETDKVNVEIESPASGIVANLTAREGDEVPVGQVIGWLLVEGEQPAQTTAPKPSSPPSPVAASPVARRMAAEHGVNLADVQGSAGRIEKADVLAYVQSRADGETAIRPRLLPASPRARRLAAERGISLAQVSGSGMNGAIIVRDVQAALAQQAAIPPLIASTPPAYRSIPLSGIRRVAAERLQASYQSAPHIALTLSIDMTETLRLMERVKPPILADTGQSLTMTAVLCKATAAALVRHPRLNAHLADGEIREYDAVHLGVAVALDDGLIAPVIRAAGAKGLAALQTELRDLTERARAGALKPHEVKGSTFTLSNLGMFGVEQFTSILNPPEVGILSVGAMTEHAAGVNGELLLRPFMQVTLNCDHRAVDGAVGARFLQTLKSLLENPYLLAL